MLGLGALVGLEGCGLTTQALSAMQPDPRMSLLGLLVGKEIENEENAKYVANQINQQRNPNAREGPRADANGNLFFLCSYLDGAHDGIPGISLNDCYAVRNPGDNTFYDDEMLTFTGFIQSPKHAGWFSKPISILKVYDPRGREIFSETADIKNQGIVHYQPFDAGSLSPGNYRAEWRLNDTVIGSLDAEIVHR